MTEKRREPSDEIKRALQILDNRNAADDDVEAAFRTLARLLPSSSPRHDFSQRVITAVCQASLPTGRRRLRARRPAIIAGLSGAVAAAGVWALLWTTGFVQLLGGRIFLLVVQGGVRAIHSVSFMVGMWRWMERAARVFTAVLSSPEMLSTVVVLAVLSVLSLAALTRFVSSSQRRSIGCS